MSISEGSDFFNVSLKAMNADSLLDFELAQTALVSDIWERLLRAGHCRICKLLRDACLLESSACFEGLFVRGMTNDVTEDLIADGHDVREAMKAETLRGLQTRRKEGKLKLVGYSTLELKETGFPFNSLNRLAPLRDVLQLGYTIKEAKHDRLTSRQLHDAGCTLAELTEAGFALLDFARGGFTLSQLLKAGVKFDATELKHAGYGVGQVKEFLPFDAMIRGGYSLKEMRNAGYTALTLKVLGGYCTEDLVAVGFTQKELLSC